jgi:aspartate kinase
MAIIVQKFGGSSVADTNKLFIVCNHIIKEYDSGNDIVAVVSAQRKNDR